MKIFARILLGIAAAMIAFMWLSSDGSVEGIFTDYGQSLYDTLDSGRDLWNVILFLSLGLIGVAFAFLGKLKDLLLAILILVIVVIATLWLFSSYGWWGYFDNGLDVVNYLLIGLEISLIVAASLYTKI